MAFTVAAAFDQFYDAINLAGDHRETANSRRDHVVGLMRKNFDVIEAFGTGSIPKFTALSGQADLDVMVVLHYTKHIRDKTPTQVLQSVRDALGQYRNQVRKNGQAVTLHYNTWPNVDIVPVYYTADGSGAITHYNVPNSRTESWIESRPKQHSSAIDLRAGDCGGNFRRAIKMLKSWNLGHSEYLQSYHIEVIALQTFSAAMTEITWDIYQFLSKCHDLVGSPLWYDGGWADTYLSHSDRLELTNRLSKARDTARQAWFSTYSGNNDHKTAITLWRQLFGDAFPSYG